AAFRDEYGDEFGLLDLYHEGSRDRMRENFAAALGHEDPPQEPYVPSRRRWREIAAQMPFPPSAAFAAEIAAAIEQYLGGKIDAGGEWLEARAAAPVAASGGLLRLFAAPPSPPHAQEPLPDHVEDLAIVRREAADWLARMRALMPDQAPYTAERER